MQNAEPEIVVCDACQLVPVSHLSFDVLEPVAGWEQSLAERGVELLEDDIGRWCIRREAARTLIRDDTGHFDENVHEGVRDNGNAEDEKLPASASSWENDLLPP